MMKYPATCTPLDYCQWEDATVAPVTPAPTDPVTGGNCQPLLSADTVALKQACYAATNVASCPVTMCVWVPDAYVSNGPVPAGEIQLFTKEFCHPSEIDVSKFE